MEWNDTSPAPPETTAKRIRKRALHACLRCRARKVRCDVELLHGQTCMNCKLDHVECVVTRSRRIRTRRRGQGGKARRRMPKFDHQNPSERLTNQEANLVTPHSVKPLEQLQPLDMESEASGGSSEFRQDLIAEDASLPGYHRFQDDHCSPSSSTSYMVYSDYPFLAIGNLPCIPSQDLQFLKMQGCLHVPSRSILDDFIRQYFLHMHPLLPLINEGDFWDTYSACSSGRQKNGTIPLLVFQAILFASSNFVPLITLSKLNFSCTREARSALYRRAKLLFDFDAEISSVAKSQAALLLASWSFPGSSVSHKPSVPWLSIAIEHAKNAEAHRYQELGIAPCDQAILKRLWWCCVIRDRVLSLVARRGIQIDRGQFDFDFKAPLGLFDLADEFHRSKVHDLSTKVDLAKIFELLVELCIVLTDILQLAFPIEDKLSRGKLHIAAWKGVRECRLALHKWHQRAVSRLARFASPSSAVSDGHEYHDSVILYTNLLRMYYYSSKIVLSHHELLHLITTPPSSSDSFLDAMAIQHNHSELWDAALGTTSCLEKLLRLRLARWLPISAVSCTALPLLLHILNVEILPPSQPKNSSNVNLNNHRLKILRKAMETYEVQYEGTNWIAGVIKHIVNLKCTTPAIGLLNLNSVRQRSPTVVDGWIEILTSRPGWYLDLAFTIDLTMSKGDLPNKALLGNLDKLLVKENCPVETPVQDKLMVEFAEEDDYDTVSILPDANETPNDSSSVPLKHGESGFWANLLEIQDAGETQEAMWLTESYDTAADPGAHCKGLIPDEILAGEGLYVLSQV